MRLAGEDSQQCARLVKGQEAKLKRVKVLKSLSMFSSLGKINVAGARGGGFCPPSSKAFLKSLLIHPPANILNPMECLCCWKELHQWSVTTINPLLTAAHKECFKLLKY